MIFRALTIPAFTLLTAGLFFVSGCTSTGEIPDLKTAKRAESQGDMDRAYAHYQTLAEKGYTEAKVALVRMELAKKTPMTPENRAALEKTLLSDSGSNSAKNYELLAQLALDQKRPDHAKAIEYYQMAFDAGSAKAALNIGDIYAERRQGKKAIEWYSNAYNAGDTKGIYRIGRVYEKGAGVSRNLVTALSYYLWAKDEGVPAGAKGADRLSLKLSPADQKKSSENWPSLKSRVAISH